MPWCEECDRFWNPNSMAPDGSCPRCGRVLAETPPEHERTGMPWHFWLLVVLMAAYLLWRIIQLTMRLIG